jgi:hypothetical protein
MYTGTVLTLNPMNRRQSLSPTESSSTFTSLQLLEFEIDIICWYERFYGFPIDTGPELAQQHQHQYRGPSSGPRRNQRRKGFRMAEAQILYSLKHESSGKIAEDRSTGINPSYARIGANDNAGAGKVWEPRQETH